MPPHTLSAPAHLRNIRVELNSRIVSVPVSGDVFAYWHEQFVRQNPTSAQRQRFRTLMNLVRAAYLKGHEDGQNRL
jgi:hypothetical protein